MSAYLHVLADALTSLLAILALVAAKYFGWIWADPLMGVAGAVLVARWSIGLLRTTSAILLDRQAPTDLTSWIERRLRDRHDAEIVDLHVWSVGPSMYAAIVSVETPDPRVPDTYRASLAAEPRLVHVSVEVNLPVAAAR